MTSELFSDIAISFSGILPSFDFYPFFSRDMVFGHLFVVLDDLASSLPSYPQEVLLVKGLLRFEIEYTVS